tara:strand:+ start:4453 stop:5094 length:642 start_codon:yes stop_codon:yes gene_type:complete
MRHKIILGTTRYGKSYYANKMFVNDQWNNYYGIYIDTQKSFPNHHYTYDEIDDLGFQEFRKIIYLPYKEELEYIIKWIMECGEKNAFMNTGCIIIIDEIHFYIGEHYNRNDSLEIAIMHLFEYGLRFNITAVAISHTITKVNKRIRDLCTEQIFFNSNLDISLKNYGIDINDKVKNHIEKKYHYVKRLYSHELLFMAPINEKGEEKLIEIYKP